MSDRRADQIDEQAPRAPEEPAVDGCAEADGASAEAADESVLEEIADLPGEQEEVGEQDEVGESEEGGEPEAEEDELTVARRERDEYLSLAQRAQADFENFRKRAAKEAAAAGRRAKSGLIGELLPVVDNLERALASASEGEEHLADGVRLVHSELLAVLARNGVEQFDPAGEKFDPAVHEALSTREHDGADPGVVVDVVEKGYSLSGAVLRPARVVVSG